MNLRRFTACTDKTLIDELEQRGYLVAKRGHLLKISASHLCTEPHHPAYATEGYLDWLREHLCELLGHGLSKPGYVKFIERPAEECGPMAVKHEAILTFVVAEPEKVIL